MSDTPFTDSRTYGFTDEDGIHCEAVHADFARKLERERNEARRLLATARESLNAIHVEVGGWIAEMMKEGK